MCVCLYQHILKMNSQTIAFLLHKNACTHMHSFIWTIMKEKTKLWEKLHIPWNFNCVGLQTIAVFPSTGCLFICFCYYCCCRGWNSYRLFCNKSKTLETIHIYYDSNNGLITEKHFHYPSLKYEVKRHSLYRTANKIFFYFFAKLYCVTQPHHGNPILITKCNSSFMIFFGI